MKRLATILALGAACSRPAEPLSPAVPTPGEEALARDLGIEADVVALLRRECGSPATPLMGRDADGEPRKATGVTATISARRAPEIVQRLRPALAPRGYLPFHSESNFDIGGQPDKVSILKAADPYEILRVMGTNGANYDLDTDKVIARLREWEKAHPFEIVGADFDWTELRFTRLPSDLAAFARDAYAFCPDIVDQGVGSVSALAREIRKTGRLYLWWD